MKKALLSIISIILVLVSFSITGADTKVEVTLENCEPYSWVGMVQYLNNKTAYKDLPHAEIKRTGKLTIMLEPGEYGITHYRPRETIMMENGKTLVIIAKILDFREVVITKPVTLSFGCEWRMDGAV